MNRNWGKATDKRSLRTVSGFTLNEVLVALAVFLILSTGVITVYLMSLRTWQEGSMQVSLQRKLAAAMDRMVQGQRGSGESRQNGLREAQSVTLIDPQTIEYISGIDGATRRFYLQGNEILYSSENIIS